jgi:uncharacterized protein YdcH (DUF465 family)
MSVNTYKETIMEIIGEPQLEAVRRESREFRSLESRHRELETELTELVRHRTLTPQEELHKKELQKHKLAIKDRLTRLLQGRRHTGGPSGDRRRRQTASSPEAA